MITSQWLWMDEDELRRECYELLRAIFVLRCQLEVSVGYGYERGFEAGALSQQAAIEEGDAACLVLH